MWHFAGSVRLIQFFNFFSVTDTFQSFVLLYSVGCRIHITPHDQSTNHSGRRNVSSHVKLHQNTLTFEIEEQNFEILNNFPHLLFTKLRENCKRLTKLYVFKEVKYINIIVAFFRICKID